MKRLILAAVFAVICLSSCVKGDEVNILGVDDVKLTSLNSLEVTVTIENRSAHNITMKNARFSFKNGDREVADIILAEPVKAPRRSTTALKLLLKLNLKDLTGLMTMSQNPEEAIAKLSASGEIVVKASGARKKYKVKDVPMSQILDVLKIDPSKPKI